MNIIELLEQYKGFEAYLHLSSSIGYLSTSTIKSTNASPTQRKESTGFCDIFVLSFCASLLYGDNLIYNLYLL